MTSKQKRELLIKRLALLISLLTIVICLVSHVANVNKNRYYVDAIWELKDDKIHFYFSNQDFAWTLRAGDKIPNDKLCIVLLDSNGTETFSDDKIISFH